MYKILIAEDENWLRKGIVSMIKWDQLQCELVCEACDGKVAIEQIYKKKPDIILIDIRMPAVDGLNVISSIKNELYFPKIIIISGYDNFKYAQDAISLGVFYYLLKPVKKDELNDVLKRAIQLLENERNKQNNLESAEYNYKEVFPIAREKLLCDIIAGKISSYNKSNFSVIPQHPYYSVSIISLYSYSLIKENGISDIKTDVLSMLGNILKEHDNCIFFMGQNNLYVIISGYRHKNEMQSFDLSEYIVKNLNESTIYSISLGLGQLYEGVENIYLSYNEALKAVNEKITFGSNNVIRYSEIDNLVFNISLIESNLKLLYLSVEIGDRQTIKSVISDIIDLMNQKKQLCYENIVKLIDSIIHSINNIMSKYTLSGTGICIKHLDYIDSIDNLKDYLFNYLIDDSKKILNIRRMESKKAVERAIEFIGHHYTEEITLEQLASYVFLSPVYISEVFKKETGKNFTEYVTILRMEFAKELLLKSSNISIAKVAEVTGYKDYRYFSKLFLRYIGIKPSEYREAQIGRKDNRDAR